MKKFIVFRNTLKKFIVFGRHYEKIHSDFGERPNFSLALYFAFKLTSTRNAKQRGQTNKQTNKQTLT